LSMDASAFAPAQTNTQLYLQMHELGFTEADLVRVQQVYRVACLMVNGRYRYTERPFICHLVGSASSAAHFGGNVDLALAAMMHASYDSGLFPDGRVGGRSPAHRAWLRGEIGTDVEEIVSRLVDFRQKLRSPEEIAANWRAGSGDEDLVFLILAHEVDDNFDGGLAFAPKFGEALLPRAAACDRLAQSIGRPELGAAILANARRFEGADWAHSLRREKPVAYRIAPGPRAYLKLLWRGRRRQTVKVH
jgi:hypothetical protein